MDIKKEEYQKIIDKFPDVISIDGNNYNLLFKINDKNLLEVDFRKYPKKVKAYLVNGTNGQQSQF